VVEGGGRDEKRGEEWVRQGGGSERGEGEGGGGGEWGREDVGREEKEEGKGRIHTTVTPVSVCLGRQKRVNGS